MVARLIQGAFALATYAGIRWNGYKLLLTVTVKQHKTRDTFVNGQSAICLMTDPTRRTRADPWPALCKLLLSHHRPRNVGPRAPSAELET